MTIQTVDFCGDIRNKDYGIIGFSFNSSCNLLSILKSSKKFKHVCEISNGGVLKTHLATKHLGTCSYLDLYYRILAI